MLRYHIFPTKVERFENNLYQKFFLRVHFLYIYGGIYNLCVKFYFLGDILESFLHCPS